MHTERLQTRDWRNVTTPTRTGPYVYRTCGSPLGHVTYRLKNQPDFLAFLGGLKLVTESSSNQHTIKLALHIFTSCYNKAITINKIWKGKQSGFYAQSTMTKSIFLLKKINNPPPPQKKKKNPTTTTNYQNNIIHISKQRRTNIHEDKSELAIGFSRHVSCTGQLRMTKLCRKQMHSLNFSYT